MLELFIAEVVPILQRRGLFRTACTGETPMATYTTSLKLRLAWLDRRGLVQIQEWRT
jgi:hypothetical protein